MDISTPLGDMENRLAAKMARYGKPRPRGWGRGKADWKKAPGATPPGQSKPMLTPQAELAPRANSDVPGNRAGKIGRV